MKAKQHTLIVLLVFVLAAGAALTLLTHANQKAEQAASEAEDGSIPLLDVTIATLESISIQYGGETLTLRLSDDGWTLTEDPTYHLDDSACNTIRTALAGMKAKRQLEAQPGEDYGFDAPQLVVNVSAAGESTTLTVGAENPVTGDVYVRREGGDAVYTVDAARFRCMEQTKAELFGAFSPAGITVSNIEAVRYTLQSGETIKLQSVSQPTEPTAPPTRPSGSSPTSRTTHWIPTRRTLCWPHWPAMSPGRTLPPTFPPAASTPRW